MCRQPNIGARMIVGNGIARSTVNQSLSQERARCRGRSRVRGNRKRKDRSKTKPDENFILIETENNGKDIACRCVAGGMYVWKEVICDRLTYVKQRETRKGKCCVYRDGG